MMHISRNLLVIAYSRVTPILLAIRDTVSSTGLMCYCSKAVLDEDELSDSNAIELAVAANSVKNNQILHHLYHCIPIKLVLFRSHGICYDLLNITFNDW